MERGKIVLAEFGYGGTLCRAFPKWLIDGTKPTRAAWLLKEKMLPPIYWKAMLRGHEWMARTAARERRARVPPRRRDRRACRMQHCRYLPILDWGRRYDRATLTNDLVAAVIVTIMLIPQSLAYALLAGLPPEAGLYASIRRSALRDLRHLPRAGGGAGGGRVADDRGGRRARWRTRARRAMRWPR